MPRLEPLAIATLYSQLGWNVLPAKPREKLPWVKWKDFQHARTEPYLQEWFKGQGPTNYFLVTGKVSGVLVVDCDTAESERWLRGAIGEKVVNECAVAETGKGNHYYFKYPESKEIRNWSNAEVGFDVRAEGGGVVLPPSTHTTGRKYRWRRLPKALPLAPEPLWGPEPGSGHSVSRKGLPELLRALPKPGERNLWLAQVAGHLAKRYRDDYELYCEKLAKAYGRIEPFEQEGEFTKTRESIWKAEQSKEFKAAAGFLIGDEGRLWSEDKQGERLEWADFNPVVRAVVVSKELDETAYELGIERGSASDHISAVLDSSTLSNRQALERWLANRQLSILPPTGDVHRNLTTTRLQRFLQAQDAPRKSMLEHLGWHEGVGFVTFEGVITAEGLKKEKAALGIPPERVPFRYGFVREQIARETLAEVMTFHEQQVCAVFGAWWATCFLKAQIMQRVSLFPFMALEAASASGKTTGFFSMMVEMNGNYYKQGEFSIAAVRDRMGAHRNGIVWVDDMSRPQELIDLLRQATAEGSRAKMAENRRNQETVKLLAPVVIAGEDLGTLWHQKALLDRAVYLEAESPVERISLKNGGRLQWDDILELRERWSDDLTQVAGTLCQMALQWTGAVSKLPGLRIGSGRAADKWAILRFGGRVLAKMLEDTTWAKIVDEWVYTQAPYDGLEDDLTLHVLPTILAMTGIPSSPYDPRAERGRSAFVDKDGVVWYNLPILAEEWRRLAGRDFIQRTQSQTALHRQGERLGANRAMKDVGSHAVRARYWGLPVNVSESVIKRAEGQESSRRSGGSN